jgi:hypothetical protein
LIIPLKGIVAALPRLPISLAIGLIARRITLPVAIGSTMTFAFVVCSILSVLFLSLSLLVVVALALFLRFLSEGAAAHESDRQASCACPSAISENSGHSIVSFRKKRDPSLATTASRSGILCR